MKRVYWRIYTEEFTLIGETNSVAQLRYFLVSNITNPAPHGSNCKCGLPAYVFEYPLLDVLTVDEWLARVS